MLVFESSVKIFLNGGKNLENKANRKKECSGLSDGPKKICPHPNPENL